MPHYPPYFIEQMKKRIFNKDKAKFIEDNIQNIFDLYDNNFKLGIQTIFIDEVDLKCRACLKNNKIVINLAYNHSMKEINKSNLHEVLHFLSNSPEFRKSKCDIFKSMSSDEFDKLKKEYIELYPKYADKDNQKFLYEEILCGILCGDVKVNNLVSAVTEKCLKKILNPNKHLQNN